MLPILPRLWLKDAGLGLGLVLRWMRLLRRKQCIAFLRAHLCPRVQSGLDPDVNCYCGGWLSLLAHTAAHTAKALAQGCRMAIRARFGVAIDVLARGVKAVCFHGDCTSLTPACFLPSSAGSGDHEEAPFPQRGSHPHVGQGDEEAHFSDPTQGEEVRELEVRRHPLQAGVVPTPETHPPGDSHHHSIRCCIHAP